VAIEVGGIDAARDVTAVTARAQQVDSWAPGIRDRKFVVVPLAITGRTIPVGPDGDWFAGIPVS
jgi:hypothetical protein